MTVSRRRIFRSIALSGGACAVGQGQAVDASSDAVRQVAVAHGVNLSDDRLRILKPVLVNRKLQLQTLRDIEVSDAVAPTQGILTHGRF